MKKTFHMGVKLDGANSNGNPAPKRASRGLFRFLKESCGQDLAEYALILSLLSLGAIAGLSPLAHTLSNTFKWAAACHSRAQASQARACQDTGPRTPPPKS